MSTRLTAFGRQDTPLGRVRKRWLLGWLLGLATLAVVASAGAAPKPEVGPGVLRAWTMQSSAEALEGGAQITQAGFAARKWYPVRVPCTVLAGLVQNGEYPDLMTGTKLRDIPKERFSHPWWYRTTFRLPQGDRGKRVWLDFRGISYRADIWVNGTQVASSKDVVGTFRDFALDISSVARFGAEPNVVAVSVTASTQHDLDLWFVDWCQTPPDRNMGLWQEVVVRTSAPVTVRHPYVDTDLEVPSLARARLAVFADVTNPTGQPVTGVLQGAIGPVRFSTPVALAAYESRSVEISPDRHPELVLSHPRVWWPWQLGKPEMYHLSLAFAIDGRVSDQASLDFGIRKITSRLADGHRAFTVNGVDLLILGAGYCPDLLQRRELPGRPHWQEDQIRYVRDLNLNTIRLEGKLEDDAFYDLCDRNGILVMAGWCCGHGFEEWGLWKEQYAVAPDSLRTQIRRARTHPCMLAWLNGSDKAPPAPVEKSYLEIESQLHFPCPTLSSATEAKTSVTGASGVKMRGPYEWTPPIYWMTDKHEGGAYGFNTEVGPGPAPPPLESLEQMLPPEHRWPIDEVWNYHCGGGEFKTLDRFNHALEARYGKPVSLSDYSWKAQAMAYETFRPMFEAFSRNKPEATGEVQWMLNNAWPSMIWHLYDYYMRPGGSYFGAKVGCEPLHILYSYDDRSVVVTNNRITPVSGLTAKAEILDLAGKRRFEKSSPCEVGTNTKSVVCRLPEQTGIGSTYFVRLTLTDAAHRPVSINSYWLSTKPDVPDWKKNTWFYVPCSSYADLTDLQELPRVTLRAQMGKSQRSGTDETVPVRVTNEGKSIAMLVRLKLNRPDSQELLPILWSDNYFLLLPGESREVTARYRIEDRPTGDLAVEAGCFNNRL